MVEVFDQVLGQRVPRPADPEQRPDEHAADDTGGERHPAPAVEDRNHGATGPLGRCRACHLHRHLQGRKDALVQRQQRRQVPGTLPASGGVLPGLGIQVLRIGAGLSPELQALHHSPSPSIVPPSARRSFCRARNNRVSTADCVRPSWSAISWVDNPSSTCITSGSR